LAEGYDDERRLLYVVIKRAKSYVVFAAGEEPNVFLESSPVETEFVDLEVESVASEDHSDSTPLSI
jgi:superfamily I DNA/RNA helicase